MTSTQPRIYSLVDLFAGCGGLSLGFEQQAFTPVFVSELDKDALSTYLNNRHHTLGGLSFSQNPALQCQDAHELTGKRIDQLKSDLKALPELSFALERNTNFKHGGGSNLDVLAGGPPCQGYSGIGIRRSYAVDRKDIPSNHLYDRMAEIIRNLRPRIFLFENVRGLLNAKWDRGGTEKIFPDVKRAFDSIPGYDVRWSLVFAKDYGVPQNRPRVLLVGIRQDISRCSKIINLDADPENAVACNFLPSPSGESPPHLFDLLSDLIDPNAQSCLLTGEYPEGPFQTTAYPSTPKNKIQKSLRAKPLQNSRSRIELTEQEYSKHKPDVVRKFLYMLDNEGRIPHELKTKKFSQRVLRKYWDATGPNITATSLPDDYVHFCQPRILTVREWARLQLFPDWYVFSGKRTTGGLRRAGNPVAGIFDREVPKYTQIGNAVPVGLAKRIAAHFRLILDDAIV